METILILLLIIFVIAFLVYKNNKGRKEPLTIMIDDNTVRLFLSQDDYWNIDISDIKDNKQKINEKIKEVIKNRAFELKELVDRVSFFDNKNEKFAKELLEIIKNG